MPDALGLDQYMREAYKVLVRERQCTTEQVAAHLGLACPDAEKTLERLTSIGLAAATSSPGDGPRQLVPLDPQQTIAVKLARKQAELKAEQQKLSKARDSVASLVTAFTGKDAQTDTRNLSQGTEAVRARIADLLQAAQTDVAGIVDERARPIAFDLDREVVESALSRGVTVRVLHPSATTGDPQYVSKARWLDDAGGQVRTSSELPPPMLVVDGTTALLPADGAGATGLVVHNRPLSRALSMFFDQLWGEAGGSPLPAAAATSAASAGGAGDAASAGGAMPKAGCAPGASGEAAPAGTDTRPAYGGGSNGGTGAAGTGAAGTGAAGAGC